jgi:hypothetical protein
MAKAIDEECTADRVSDEPEHEREDNPGLNELRGCSKTGESSAANGVEQKRSGYEDDDDKIGKGAAVALESRSAWGRESEVEGATEGTKKIGEDEVGSGTEILRSSG